MALLTATGIGSGLDIGSIVSQLVAAERAPQENRLNAKEALIQARLSAFGSLKSALSNFQSSLSALKNPETFSKRAVTVGDSAVFTASATGSAVAGSYSVQVERLATQHKIASAAYGSSDSSVGTGTLSFSANGESFAVDIPEGEDSLAAIRDAINSAEDNFGVTATIINDQDGAHLILSADKTGVENQLTVAVSTDVGDSGDLSQLSFDPQSLVNPMTEKQEALDSLVIVDGYSQTSANRVFEDMIEGVTLTLAEARPGESISLEISRDPKAVRQSIESFVKNYNTLAATLADLTAYDVATNTAGLLQGDSTARGIATQLRREMSSIISSSDSFNSLASLGITTGDKGRLEIDSDALSDVLANNFEDIGDLFAGENGFALRLDKLVGNLNGSGGILQTRTDGLESQIERIGDKREQLDRRIAIIEARYRDQFNVLDGLLGQLNSTGDFLNSQLQNLPGFTFKND